MEKNLKNQSKSLFKSVNSYDLQIEFSIKEYKKFLVNNSGTYKRDFSHIDWDLYFIYVLRSNI